MTLRARIIASAAALLAVASVTLLGAQESGRSAGATVEITNKDLLDGLANPTRWLTHSGDYTGARFSPLTQITSANVAQLAPQWMFQTNVVNKFEATPIVVDGVLYVTGSLNHAWAIDGRTGSKSAAASSTAASRCLAIGCS
jgi:alcohol dehydrogenase (cytochrome c)